MLQIEHVAALTGLGATTIYKIKRGITEDPGIDTARIIVARVPEALTAPREVALADIEAARLAKTEAAERALRAGKRGRKAKRTSAT